MTGVVPKSPSNGLESQGKETEWERRGEGDRARPIYSSQTDRLTAGNSDWREEKGVVEKVVPSRVICRATVKVSRFTARWPNRI